MDSNNVMGIYKFSSFRIPTKHHYVIALQFYFDTIIDLVYRYLTFTNDIPV